MAEQVRLTDAERRKFECRCRPGRPGSWQHDRRCIVPVVECIIAAHLQAAPAEDAARLAEVERLLTEYESAITWDTTCLNCSSLMHKNIAEYVRAEKAEERLAAVQEIADRGITGWDLTPTVSGNEDVTWWYDYLRALDNIWRTRVRAALGVTAPTASEAGDARCGCTVGGLHRYGCGLVGRVDGHPAPAEVSEVEGSDREVG